jgi:hypothetical protein
MGCGCCISGAIARLRRPRLRTARTLERPNSRQGMATATCCGDEHRCGASCRHPASLRICHFGSRSIVACWGIKILYEFRGHRIVMAIGTRDGFLLKGVAATSRAGCQDRQTQIMIPVSTGRTAQCLYSIISSARARSDSGTVSPSALATLRLMTSSTLVGWSTGSSPGFAPLRTFPT